MKETTTLESMPNGTTIRTTETVPVDAGNARAVRTTIHERAESSGQMTRTTITQSPDGSRVKQIETIRPGGSKSVMMETTDPRGHKTVETAEYPPTLVSTPEEYGMGSGQTVVSEITFSRTVAPWHSPADHPSNGGSRPIDVDAMKELEGGGYYDYDGKRRQTPPPYWTLKRKLLLAAGTVLLAVVAAGAAVGIVLAGGNDDTSQKPVVPAPQIIAMEMRAVVMAAMMAAQMIATTLAIAASPLMIHSTHLSLQRRWDSIMNGQARRAGSSHHPLPRPVDLITGRI